MAMKAVLRFLAALAPAHLLQNSRDTNALHRVFADLFGGLSLFLPCSGVRIGRPPTTCENLTGSRLPVAIVGTKCPAQRDQRFSSDEVAIAGIA
jgi:hypothetical protein